MILLSHLVGEQRGMVMRLHTFINRQAHMQTRDLKPTLNQGQHTDPLTFPGLTMNDKILLLIF